MNALIIMVLAFAGYIIMYQLYGKYIGSKIFVLSGIRTNSTKAERRRHQDQRHNFKQSGRK